MTATEHPVAPASVHARVGAPILLAALSLGAWWWARWGPHPPHPWIFMLGMGAAVTLAGAALAIGLWISGRPVSQRTKLLLVAAGALPFIVMGITMLVDRIEFGMITGEWLH